MKKKREKYDLRKIPGLIYVLSDLYVNIVTMKVSGYNCPVKCSTGI